MEIGVSVALVIDIDICLPLNCVNSYGRVCARAFRYFIIRGLIIILYVSTGHIFMRSSVNLTNVRCLIGAVLVSSASR